MEGFFMYDNKIKIEFESKSQNEGFARVAIAAFVSQLDPTIEEITDVKTAVSEAVTNSIIHGYEGREDEKVLVEAELLKNEITIRVIDYGKGIEDVEKAKEPLYTSRPDLERSGMGFTVMETFMDSMEVESKRGEGTRVVLKKKFDTVS
jgi:stage II sporulation protein AB (anti-sigma F factor)